MALNVTVHFKSPVNEGDDVEMTCAYYSPSTEGVQLRWYRKTRRTTDSNFHNIWIYTKTENSVTEEFAAKFKFILHDATHHQIKLLDVKKNDEALYMCSIYDSNLNNLTSSEKALDVGECCEHVWYTYKHIFTSLVKEVMFLVALVCLSVCLLVCLWTTLLKKL